MSPDHEPPKQSQHQHWELMRDLVKFQAKLVVDGLRDILMSPVSIVAVVAGMIVDRNQPQLMFRRVLDFGHRTEKWINLFNRADGQVVENDPGIDELFAKLERRIVDQYQRGGATASAKHAVDRSLNSLHRGLDRLKGQLSEAETSPSEERHSPPENPAVRPQDPQG